STGIGTSAVRMIDLAGAYGAFANGGHKVTAFGIVKVVAGDGETPIDNTHPALGDQVMTPAQAWSITQILRGYNKKWSVPIKYDTAAKSGTTDEFVDAWYTVYSPDWVVSTWAGHTSGTNPAEQPMNGLYGTSEGIAVAAPFINQLPKPSAFQPV